MRARIMRVMGELGYIRDGAARALQVCAALEIAVGILTTLLLLARVRREVRCG